MAIIKSKVETNHGMKYTEDLGTEKIELRSESHDFILHCLTNLYADPATAVVRELVTNAYDSGSKEVYVDLHYDEFVITDFGCGMTKDQIENNYIAYANSTKTYSMDEVGAFGLGAKAPLAIASQYVVESSIGDGECHRAIVSYTDKGFFYKIESDAARYDVSYTMVSFNYDVEKYGDTISLALEDFSFYASTKKLYVNGSTADHYAKIDLVDGIQIYGNGNINEEQLLSAYLNNEKHKVVIRVNGIPYTVVEESRLYLGQPRYSFVIDVEPGEVQFSPSREEISVASRKEILEKYSDYERHGDRHVNEFKSILNKDWAKSAMFKYLVGALKHDCGDWTGDIGFKATSFVNDLFDECKDRKGSLVWYMIYGTVIIQTDGDHLVKQEDCKYFNARLRSRLNFKNDPRYDNDILKENAIVVPAKTNDGIDVYEICERVTKLYEEHKFRFYKITYDELVDPKKLESNSVVKDYDVKYMFDCGVEESKKLSEFTKEDAADAYIIDPDSRSGRVMLNTGMKTIFYRNKTVLKKLVEIGATQVKDLDDDCIRDIFSKIFNEKILDDCVEYAKYVETYRCNDNRLLALQYLVFASHVVKKCDGIFKAVTESFNLTNFTRDDIVLLKKIYGTPWLNYTKMEEIFDSLPSAQRESVFKAFIHDVSIIGDDCSYGILNKGVIDFIKENRSRYASFIYHNGLVDDEVSKAMEADVNKSVEAIYEKLDGASLFTYIKK